MLSSGIGDSPMKKTPSKRMIQDIFDLADIQVNGNRPWDIQVRNPKFYKRVLAGGSLALGESYMDEWWDCLVLDQFFDKILGARLDQKVRKSKQALWAILKAKMTNVQKQIKGLRSRKAAL
jgi:cyclopropane-fatty-acyl-phospholipid synthase